jgi:hypothetical protein
MFEREAHHPAIRFRFAVERKIFGQSVFIIRRGRRLLRRRRVRLPLELTLLIVHAGSM